ncbi:MAG: hypothetical protein KGH55_00840 [Nanoarchaeota archaeon]|nr:hypothetical protein [Nanoarchaeota archaeon]
MKAIGFSFNKISIERFSNKLEELKANTNINILEIIPAKADFIKTKEELISVKFEYTIKYDPEYAKIEFSGDMVLEAEPKMAKEVMKDWKDKKLSEEFRIFVFNIILRKANLKALELEDDLNLPLHIPLPFIQKEDK